MAKPKIRLAKNQDIPEITRLAHEAQKTSKYSGFVNLNENLIRGALLQLIRLNNGKEWGSSLVSVADRGGELEGVIIGVVRPLYEIVEIPVVSDLFWFAAQGAHPTTAIRLLRALHAWAENLPSETVILRHAVTNAISDPDRSGALLLRQGFAQEGHIYEKELHQ